MEYEIKNIENIIKNSDKIYAHKKEIKGGTEYETLKEHSDRVLKYFKIIDSEKDILGKVKKTAELAFDDYSIEKTDEKLDFVVQMFLNAVYLHDVGKSNPGFQFKAMGNKLFGDSGNRRHSLPSALIFADMYFGERKNRFKEISDRKLNIFIAAFSYIISRHHSDLEDADISEFGREMANIAVYEKEMLANYNDEIKNPKNIETAVNSKKLRLDKNQSKYIYVLTKLLYSVLVACDFAATYEYMNGKEAEVINETDLGNLAQRYYDRELISDIRQKKGEGINALRTEIFLESEGNLLKNTDKNIFYLEAPTGSGKTNTSINLALNLAKSCGADSIFYVFPFNTLAEQTSQVMEFWENRRDFIVMNSDTPIVKEKNCDENTEYEHIYFNYQLANYPVVITSHVRLFEALFGTGRESTIWLYKLCGGVIILDEIQSCKNGLWHYFINILKAFCDCLDIKVIIMSATLPKLGQLVKDENADDSVCSLIDSRKYFENPIFKNRVVPDFSLLSRNFNDEGLESLADTVLEKFYENEDKKILAEFITKKSAREFYNILKERETGLEIAEISGDDNKAVRRNIIDKIKKREIDIVAATQVIEAGVDISLDIGFKDISILDSEEQFMGRINRSCAGEGYVYFFDYDKETNIYRGDLRTNYSLRKEDMRQILVNKRFDDYYGKVLESINLRSDSSDFNVNLPEFLKSLSCFEYKKVKDKLKLIDNNNIQIVLNFECQVGGETLRGADVWEEYKNLLMSANDMTYGEMKIRLSQVREKLDYFTFNVMGSKKTAEIHGFTEEFGGMIYFDNASELITEEGKFNREAFSSRNGECFL